VTCKKTGVVVSGLLMAGTVLLLAGCAKHADFVELRDHLATVSKSQDQDQKRLDALQRRVESLERMKDTESTKPKLDEISARIQKLENRLAKPEETSSAPVAPRIEPTP
jgi:TolA-binding protein